MPTYVYQIITDDDSQGEIFEVFQKMSDDPLTKHPETGQPVKRIIQPPNVAGKWSDQGTKKMLSNENLDRIGFTKYERSSDGTYEKKAGKGPRHISKDDY